MPRNMSFSLTTDQIRQGTKTVTRRLGWWNLKKGDLLWACVKCMGLKKGEKVERIRQIRVKSTRLEKLGYMTKEECILEGFPELEPHELIDLHFTKMGCNPETIVNRIEFTYE